MRYLVVLALGLAGVTAAAPGPPYAAADTLSRFRLDPGLRIELVASEPDVQSPVAMDIDERGRWFVVEMPGYPLDTRPTGRVRLLEDTDGDGRPDRSRIFADGLVLPNGVMRWKRGVIVTSAPDVLYLEDTDDDGRADRREVLLTGFAVTNPQHMVNTPVYGLDNWIHLAHEGPAGAVIYTTLFGDRGKPLTMPAFPDHPAVDPHRHSVRFRPDTGDLEVQSGQSQYGHGFDARGHYFTANNADHLREEMLAARYLARNPFLPGGSGQAPITDHGAAAQVFPITENPTFELLTESGEFTSACSPTPYAGGLLQGDYPRSVFVAEPVHNLVHRDVVSPSGAGDVARRGSEGREFLASTDAWFRPVSLYVGPDGALYVIDYYRKRIEHPEWTATEFQKDSERVLARAGPRPHLPDRARGRARRATAHRARRCERSSARLGAVGSDALVASDRAAAARGRTSGVGCAGAHRPGGRGVAARAAARPVDARRARPARRRDARCRAR